MWCRQCIVLFQQPRVAVDSGIKGVYGARHTSSEKQGGQHKTTERYTHYSRFLHPKNVKFPAVLITL